MKLEDFDYNLPEELIAQTPIEPRDNSRLLVLDRESGNIEHKRFYNILDYLNEGDVLVVNNTRVLPARLFATKPTGAVIEIVLLRQVELNTWEALVRPGKKAQIGAILNFPLDKLQGEVIGYGDEGTRIIKFNCQGDFYEIIDEIGQMPLPPYIKVALEDKERYQPVYAVEKGSAAAPTAGLHFTPELMEQIEAKGVKIAKVLLHVGLGTFRPVKVDEIEEHHMHSEFYSIDEENARLINETRAAGGRVISVGTTSTRVLETIADEDGVLPVKSGFTQIFIYPGYKFRAIDAMITNFHLPKSTLIMMISALAGRENVLNAYDVAIKEEYRFFSFGDAMLIK